MNKKAKKNYKKLRKAARKYYGDFSVLEPEIDLRPLMFGDQVGGCWYDSNYGIEETKQMFEDKELDMSTYPKSNCGIIASPQLSIEAMNLQNNQDKRFAYNKYPNQANESSLTTEDFISMFHTNDMSAIPFGNSYGNQGVFDEKGFFHIAKRYDDHITVMSTAPTKIYLDTGKEVYCPDYDGGETKNDSSITPAEILVSACIHSFSYMSDGFEERSAMFNTMCEIYDEFVNSTPETVSDVVKDAFNKNIIFVHACEYRIWAKALSMMITRNRYISYPPYRVESGAYYMTSDEVMKLGSHGNDPYTTSAVFDRNSNFLGHATMKEIFSIPSNGAVMIVYSDFEGVL